MTQKNHLAYSQYLTRFEDFKITFLITFLIAVFETTRMYHGFRQSQVKLVSIIFDSGTVDKTFFIQ